MAGMPLLPSSTALRPYRGLADGLRSTALSTTAAFRFPALCNSNSERHPRVQVHVDPPPADFKFRDEVEVETRALVQECYPQLMDLVEEGTLIAVKRPTDYVERRQDGYTEPEVVFVVGTAHMSKLSAKDVSRVLEAIRPENVVVELCRSRAGIMYQDEFEGGAWTKKPSNLLGLGGQTFSSAMGRSLQLGGRSALALRLLLGATSQKLSESAGVATGAEFRAARKGAEDIGAQIVLGDRPIEITVNHRNPRMNDFSLDTHVVVQYKALSWVERLKLATTLTKGIFSSNLEVSEEAIRVLKSDDAVSAMFSAMSQQFPSLLPPLVYERDVYLAWSLKRSKAVNGCSRVVGVMGRGHLRGVVYALKYTQEQLRFQDLVGVRSTRDGLPKNDKVVDFFKNLLVETLLGAGLWFAYQHFYGGKS